MVVLSKATPSLRVSVTGLRFLKRPVCSEGVAKAAAASVIVALFGGSVLIVYWPIVATALERPRYSESDSSQSTELGGQASAERNRFAQRTAGTPSEQPSIALASLSLGLGTVVHGRNVESLRLTNVALHLINTLLLLWFMKVATGETIASLFVAGVFAVHPLNVESVAWLPGRRELLGTSFALLSFLAYARFSRSDRRRDLMITFLLIVCAVLSDLAFLILPAVLLLLDLWPLVRGTCQTNGDLRSLRRTHAIVAAERHKPEIEASGGCDPQLSRGASRKWAFLAASAALAVLVFVVRDRVGNASRTPLGQGGRILEIATTCFVDLCRVLLPYHFSTGEWLVRTQLAFVGAGAIVGLVGISVLTVIMKRRFPFVFVGWLWFLGLLGLAVSFPLLAAQRVSVGIVYFPMIGLLAAAVWLVRGWVEPGTMRTVLLPVLAAANVAVFGRLAMLQVAECQHILDLVRADLEPGEGSEDAADTKSWIAEIAHLESAIRGSESDAMVYETFAVALEEVGRPEDAANYYRRALAIDDRMPVAHCNLGFNDLSRHRLPDAERHFWRALEIAPRYANAYLGLGKLCRQRGEDAEASAYVERAIEIEPSLEDDLSGTTTSVVTN
jgi:protein O-mannosyl-transferase